MKRIYTHLEPGKETLSPSGYYKLDSELRLNYRGRSLLVTVGSSVVESSCCGASSWSYAVVHGYVITWQSKHNRAGLLLSQVQPVENEQERGEISELVRRLENVATIEFW
jgi:hypothetical protein